jgi:hypothetical protein
MTKHTIVAAAAVATLLLSSVVAQAAATTAPAAKPAAKPAPTPVALTCAVVPSAKSSALTITNSTTADLAKGTKISWVLGKHKGTLKLAAALAAGKTAAAKAPGGTDATCTASYTPAK